MTEIYAVSTLEITPPHPQPVLTLTLYPQAGAVAAFTIDLLVYPLDTLKTRYQSQDYIKTGAKGHANNPFALRGLYQGIGSVVLATVPAGESISLPPHVEITLGPFHNLRVSLSLILAQQRAQPASSSQPMKTQNESSPISYPSPHQSSTPPPQPSRRWPHASS